MTADLTLFEMVMLLCFGGSWPFAIAKTIRTKEVSGASPLFYALILTGYLCGIIHKLETNPNFVLVFYVLNAAMVATQLVLLTHYRAQKSEPSRDHSQSRIAAHRIRRRPLRHSVRATQISVTDTGRLG